MKITGSFPIVITPKIDECRTFYENVFGFDTVFSADWYVHLRHAASKVEIGFMQPGLDTQPPFLRKEYAGHGFVFSLETDDARQAYAELQKKGVTFALELTDEDWGQRHCIVEDPAGMHVDIVEQLS
jgi:catechol 2,3-dioxygenase-like lactoylglutathione lyase family enzyme